MNFLKEAACNDATGRISSARVIALVAGLTLSFSTIVLTLLVYWRVELVTPLTAFGTVLGGLAGANYVTGRIVERKTKNEQPIQ